MFPALDGQGCLPKKAESVSPRLQAGGGLDSQGHPLALVSSVSELSRVKQQEGSVGEPDFNVVLLSAGLEFLFQPGWCRAVFWICAEHRDVLVVAGQGSHRAEAVSAFYVATIYMVRGLGLHGRLGGDTARTSDPR